MARELFQNAFLVDDLSEGIKRWSRVFGAGPFQIVPHHKTEKFLYRGSNIEADVSYAFGYLGDLMIQLIEQHDDRPSIYREMFPKGHEGFHHIAYLVSDFAAERSRLLNLGYSLACELFADGVNAAYFDARRDLGAFIEIHENPPHILAIFDKWRRQHIESVNASISANMDVV